MAVKIGVISDTHGILRAEVLEKLRDCDAIFHAGDFDTPAVYEQLRCLKPLYAVRGNNDWILPPEVEKLNSFKLEGVEFCMIHNRRELPPPEILGNKQVIIFGHSHKYCEETREGRLYLNPGSCGKRRFGSVLTMAVLYVDNGAFQVQKIDLP